MRNNRQEFKKIEWIKVSLNEKVKRIYNPSKDLKCLANQIKSHFRELTNMYLSLREEEPDQNEFQLLWDQTDSEQILINDNDQLEEIYLTYGIGEKGTTIPKFKIQMCRYCSIRNSEVVFKNDEIKSSLIPQNQEEVKFVPSQSNVLNSPEPLQKSEQEDELRSPEPAGLQPNDHGFQEFEEQKSQEVIEFNQDETESDDSYGSEDEEIAMIEALKYYVRKEVEKQSQQLFEKHSEQQPIQIDNQSEEGDANPFEQASVIEEAKNEQDLYHESPIDIRVSINSKKQEQGGMHIFSKIRSFIKNRKISEEVSGQKAKRPSQEFYQEVARGSVCQMSWQLPKNNIFQVLFPSQYELVKIYSNPPIEIKNQPLNYRKRVDTQSVDFDICIPYGFKENHQIIMFKIIDKQRKCYIGETFVAYLKIKESVESRNSNNSNESSNSYKSIQSSSLSESEANLQKLAYTEEQLLGIASMLYDEGSNEDNSERERKRDEFIRKENEKQFKAPEMEEDETTSFRGNYVGIKILLFSLAVVGSSYFIHKRMLERQMKIKNQQYGLDNNPKFIDFGGSWTLKDLNGDQFGSNNLYGSYYLLYFGTTRCPDVCPLSLMKLSKAIRRVKRSREGQQYIKLQGVFVTVNPEEDQPEVLQNFFTMFGDDFIPLREDKNSSENLLKMLKKYKVPVGVTDYEQNAIQKYFENIEEKKGFIKRVFSRKKNSQFDGIENDHSIVFYLMNPENRFLAYYTLDIDEKELYEMIMEEMSYDLGTKYISQGLKPPVLSQDG